MRTFREFLAENDKSLKQVIKAVPSNYDGVDKLNAKSAEKALVKNFGFESGDFDEIKKEDPEILVNFVTWLDMIVQEKLGSNPKAAKVYDAFCEMTYSDGKDFDKALKEFQNAKRNFKA